MPSCIVHFVSNRIKPVRATNPSTGAKNCLVSCGNEKYDEVIAAKKLNVYINFVAENILGPNLISMITLAVLDGL